MTPTFSRSSIAVTRASFFIAIFALTSCGREKINANEPSLHFDGDRVTFSSTVPADILNKLKDSDVNLMYRFFECKNLEKEYPVYPYVNRIRFGDSSSKSEIRTDRISGTISITIYRQYDNPCVKLSGRGYFTPYYQTKIFKL